MTRRLTLEGAPLSPEAVVSVARSGQGVTLGERGAQWVEAAYAALRQAAAQGVPIYGATTGVGTLDRHWISGAQSEAFQRDLLRSHAAGVGEPLSDVRVRAMMVVRLSQLTMGRSGISLPTLRALTEMVDRGVTPRVPSVGSVGASDLASLAHAALPLIGEGEARVAGCWLPGATALAKAQIAEPPMRGRDALAWINGPAETVGAACLLCLDGHNLILAAEAAAALGMVALGSSIAAMDPSALLVKPHPGAVASAERFCELLPAAPRAGREPLSIRCAHQVIGALREAHLSLRQSVQRELDAPVDNPVWQGEVSFPGGGAAFDTHRLAQCLDGVADALGVVAQTAERRIDRLLNANLSGLPAFLVGAPGDAALRCCGFMIAQYTAVTLVARMCSRASALGLGATTCAGFEDAVSLAPLSADRAMRALLDAARVVAIELLAAAQAVDLAKKPLSQPLYRYYAAIREHSAFLSRDRSLGAEIDALAAALLEGRLEAHSWPEQAPAAAAEE